MNIKKILVVIQRSNGDVYLSSPLINKLFEYYNHPKIDLLINDETLGVAKTLNNINNIFLFSKKEKKENRYQQEFRLIKSIYKKYDLSICLNTKDRSAIYTYLASKNTITAFNENASSAWWKKLFFNKTYHFDVRKHIIENNCTPLKLLNIDLKKIEMNQTIDYKIKEQIENELTKRGISNFIVFHPSAQYNYKVYPTHLRNSLLELLSNEGINIVVTGGNTQIDQDISNSLPNKKHIHNFIGKTSLNELLALVELSDLYIGMDTLVMHMAASLNKPIFAIFGPSNPTMWGPWENKKDQYIKVIQSNMDCVPCGKAGCDDKHGQSDCLFNISPQYIFEEVRNYLEK